MLTCRDLAEQADAFLDGEMSLAKRLQVRLHMSMCNGCARFMKQMRITRSLITAEGCCAGAGVEDKTVDTQIDSILDVFENRKQSRG
ncbi:anti-sigma factor family protein [Roseovarius arcticus]|uniref:anti-sigma factor family protein n=1 Tax=Roseovarius arcticus TaxID=2547404 RepID=UPI001110CABB|nr:zf-HC2 domain-containing protein [Roseovarius arcticus]